VFPPRIPVTHGSDVVAVSLVAALVGAAVVAASPATPATAIPDGVWLMDKKVALQVFDCAGLMCGRIVWLVKSKNAAGAPDQDKNNPDPALRGRPLCGLTMLWNLHADGLNHWRDGRLYNPYDGRSYRVTAQLKSDDVIVARIYVTAPLLGKTKTLARVPHGVSEGWC
jgi:uncharacterized protein (DUF2147 family)